MYVSSARRVVYIICGILALYSETAAETISEGLKYNIFPGGIAPDPSCACATRTFMLCWKSLLRISAYSPVEDFESLDNIEKSSYVLGSQLWESKFDELLCLVKKYTCIVDVWEIRKHIVTQDLINNSILGHLGIWLWLKGRGMLSSVRFVSLAIES